MTVAAFANADFTQGRDKALLAAACEGADVLLCCEGKDFRAVDLLPEGWRSLQVTLDAAHRGSFIAFRPDALELVDFNLVIGSHATTEGRGMLARYLAWADLREVATGGVARYIACHRPLATYPKARAEWDASLKALVASSPYPVVVGADWNAPVARIAPAFGLVGYGREVVGIATTLPAADLVSRVVPETDHPLIRVTVEVPVPDVQTPETQPYDLTTYDGRKVDWLTRQALEEAARILDYDDGKITLTQGSYNAGGVSASAGTHDGGGVVDCTAYDAERKVRVLRSLGFAAWHRKAIDGLWPEHVHAVLMGNAKLSDQAKAQVAEYLAGGDGLKGNARDDGPRDYLDARWTWKALPKPTDNHVTRGRAHLADAKRSLRLAAEELDAANGRPLVEGQVDDVRAIREAVKSCLAILPDA